MTEIKSARNILNALREMQTYGIGANLYDYGICENDIIEFIDSANEELHRLRKITACTMGVGDGSGRLFVHGDYDSIKAAQALLLGGGSK